MLLFLLLSSKAQTSLSEILWFIMRSPESSQVIYMIFTCSFCVGITLSASTGSTEYMMSVAGLMVRLPIRANVLTPKCRQDSLRRTIIFLLTTGNDSYYLICSWFDILVLFFY